MQQRKTDRICHVCQSETEGEFYRYGGICICPQCAEEYTCYADPVEICRVCEKVISDEKHLILYHTEGHSSICGSCLAKLLIRG